MLWQLPRVLTATLCALLCGCNAKLPAANLAGQAMGTTWTVQIVAPPDSLDSTTVRAAIVAELERLENIASTYRSDSEISTFNNWQSDEWFGSSIELCDMVAASLDVSAQTSGAYDISVAPLVDLWGFGPSLGDDAVPPIAAVDAVRPDIGYSNLRTDCTVPAIRKLRPAVTIDLSASAKGFAVDSIAGLLDDRGLMNYLVEIGGELRLRGKNVQRQLFSIAIESPLAGATQPARVLKLTNTSVATSGDYRNFFVSDGVRYSHIVDPRTGFPVQHELTSVTVVAASAAYADALATALLTMGPDEGFQFAEQRGIAALFQTEANDNVEQKITRAMRRLLVL